ncbi:MAG: hypothetical protein ACD_51C00281G0009 [uncultured bacterium]|nr:MAG: hypothetical protein ACD_51C00281G0009 [uncultured bacterium]OGJ47942.1 MAG: hypothetical protein A2344_04145 [Candidatus Peregrinibacteria bacterium RIFOXYB12_FULL_41_12]OGJ48514.1 MAG: hypothetical protein A2244_05835 [Candidatus Peregrinibacteria bacterium RIFOXYA2_FULL_41_18]OGJ52772.1 MAG: hypothetical protein A2448_02670 [Candidatus Peregrinibacteria bacterium RIFOXYC2_FULL_41_22]
MLPLDPRKQKILHAIIKQFIETAEPVGSKTIVISYNLSVSTATIRNDMAQLEELGLITQPHTSAGRVPTQAGYKLYVEELVDFDKARTIANENIKHLNEQYKLKKAKEKIYDAVALLSQATSNISFATIPDNKRTFYLGVSNILKQPEFVENPLKARHIIEVLEEGTSLVKTLESLNIGSTVKIFIGEENLIEQIESCSIIVTTYEIEGFKGFIGILGPCRMPYAYNKALLEEVSRLIKI